jgi:16S rRNA (guanine966-N2)-methyltransferase
MTLRITAGEFRGQRIESVTGMSSRPTSASVRNAIFNILGDIIIDARVADFFCGGGTIGIEALSRGARSCYFIDNGFKAVRVLKDNIAALNLTENSHILSMNAISSVETLQQRGEKFDIAFADPPYGKPLALPLLKTIEKSDILDDGAVMVIEVSSRNNIRFPATIRILQSKVYGDTAVHFITFDKGN